MQTCPADLGAPCASGRGETARILVIDDKRRIADVLRLFLESAGYEVIARTDPQEALRLAQTERIDLVLCDVVMPSMNGFDLCARLRSEPRTARLPLVFVTSTEQREGRLTGEVVGADGYVEKPFEQKALLELVQRLVTRGGARPELGGSRE